MTTLLEETLEAWSDARNGVIEELRNIPANRFDFRPAAGVRDAAELARHIAEVSLMMVGELTREETDLRRKPFPKLIAMYAGDLERQRSKAQLLATLNRTLKDGLRRFRDAGELHLLGLITRFDGQKGTRLAWMHHGISQEMYHRGQLTLYQRLMGIEPALTRRIRGS